MNLKQYIYEDNKEFFLDAYEDLVGTDLGIVSVLESFDKFYKFMNQPVVLSISESTDLKAFVNTYFRKEIIDIDPANIIKYFYIHVCNIKLEYDLNVIPLSEVREPNIEGDKLYLSNGNIKRLNLKYDSNYELYNDDFYE